MTARRRQRTIGASVTDVSARFIELRHLRYFLAVAEERHFTRAAARLYMSQPPLSAQIRQLEQRLGAPLFVRSPGAVELTAAGEALLEPAYAALAALDAGVDAVRAVRRVA
jgi:DNA-binding transcriptional LysR family regulator